LALKISLGTVQINQLAVDRSQLFSMPRFDGAPQFDLGGAAPGTPLPGQVSGQSILNGFNGPVPASYPSYPSTPYPATPVSMQSAPAKQSFLKGAALPIYGQRGSAATNRY
jgi:hypothetical protein